MSLELEIACLNGDVLELLVDGSWTVDQLKEEIQKRTALEAIEQQLVTLPELVFFLYVFFCFLGSPLFSHQPGTKNPVFFLAGVLVPAKVMGTTVLASSDKSLQSLIEERASLVLLRRDPVSSSNPAI